MPPQSQRDQADRAAGERRGGNSIISFSQQAFALRNASGWPCWRPSPRLAWNGNDTVSVWRRRDAGWSC